MTDVRAFFFIGLIAIFCVSTVASAAMPCCCLNKAAAGMEMAQDSGGMPCHDTADNDTGKTADCDNCDCQHCQKVSALPVFLSVQEEGTHLQRFYSGQTLVSVLPERILQPPKTYS